MKAAGLTLAVAESVTGGRISARLSPQADAPRRCSSSGWSAARSPPRRCAPRAASATRSQFPSCSTTSSDEGPDRPDFGGTVTIEIADGDGTVTRTARLVGIRDWIRTGAASSASTACAATCSACRSTSASTSSGARAGNDRNVGSGRTEVYWRSRWAVAGEVPLFFRLFNGWGPSAGQVGPASRSAWPPGRRRGQPAGARP